MKYNKNNENDIRAFAENILCPLPSAFVSLLHYHKEIEEITEYDEGDEVDYDGESVEIVSVNDDGTYDVEDCYGDTYTDISRDELRKTTAESLEPCWGTVWYFRESSDSDWAKSHTREISGCGFRMYNSGATPTGYGDVARGLGVIIGLDGCGYNFFDADNGHFQRLLEVFRGGAFVKD